MDEAKIARDSTDFDEAENLFDHVYGSECDTLDQAGIALALRIVRARRLVAEVRAKLAEAERLLGGEP